jgi:transposase-like protein
MMRVYERHNEAWWRQHLARQRSSGQRVRAYCERHGVSEHSFYRWRRRLAAGDAQPHRHDDRPHFVPVTLPANPSGSRIEIVLGGGQRISVPAGFDPATLAQVVSVLEGRPC